MKITEIFARRTNAILTESIPHPEDAIWTGGITKAQEAIAGLAAITPAAGAS